MHNVINDKKILEKIKADLAQYKEIRKLLKENNYEEIYNIYGQKKFLKYVPYKYINEDILKLIENREFEKIYNKYGPKKYNAYIMEMNMKENYDEYGHEFIDRNIRIHYEILNNIKYTVLATLIAFWAIPSILLPTIYNCKAMINSVVYAEEIELYNETIEDYAKYINSLNLNDLETIMKVIDDTWNRMKCFGEPSNDIEGYFRLQLASENSVGVCRNIADDVGARLNAINPEYNARNINVFLNIDEPILISNINIKKDGEMHNANTSIYSSIKSDTNAISGIVEKLVGNHMVLLVDIKAQNLTLVVDPTNPSIGILRNGKIYMFSTLNGNGYYEPLFGQKFYGIDHEWDFNLSKIKSCFIEINVDELRSNWGVLAQNAALENVRRVEHTYTYSKNS